VSSFPLRLLPPPFPQVGFNGYSTYLIYNTPRPQCEAGQVWDPFDAMRVSGKCLACCSHVECCTVLYDMLLYYTI
jgi:hypothetical protein